MNRYVSVLVLILSLLVSPKYDVGRFVIGLFHVELVVVYAGLLLVLV